MMAQPPQLQRFSLHEKFPALAKLGAMGEYFHGYTNRNETQHGHDDIVEMLYVLSGRGEHRIGEASFPLHPGSLGIIHFGQAHAILPEPPGLELVNVYVDPFSCGVPDLPGAFRQVLPRILPLHRALKHERNLVLHLNFSPPDQVSFLLRSFARETHAQTPGALQAARLYFQLFLIECARQLLADEAQPPAPPDAAGGGVVEEARRYLDRNFAEEITLEKLAKYCGLGRTYLCRAFRRHTGQTVFNYLHQRRIEQAMLRLATTSDGIHGLALDCGFSDLSHFNRVFRKLTGLTPGAYRRKLRSGQ